MQNHLPNLIYVNFNQVLSVNDRDIQELISYAPRLETMILNGLDKFSDLTFKKLLEDSSALKVL